MITRRQYISISVMMLVLLFMFQATNMMKQQWNKNVQGAILNPSKLGMESSYFPEDWEEIEDSERKFIVFIGSNKDNPTENTVRQWCIYTKMGLLEYNSLEEYQTISADPLLILLDGEELQWKTELPYLERLVEQGNNIIFCSLPSVQTISEFVGLRTLLGIDGITSDSVTLDGIHLYKGFLLGGEVIYEALNEEDLLLQDLDLEVPWYRTLSGTKVYMGGILRDSTVDNEELPSIIWRNSIEEQRIFVVNGSYLDDVMGIGILDAMLYELQDYQLYPIINAQNLVIADYPVLSEESQDEMMRLYSRTLKGVSRDVIWPGLVSVSQRVGGKINLMMAPQLDYQDGEQPQEEILTFYQKMLREYQGELGISGERLGDVSLEQKMQEDQMFLDKIAMEDGVRSLYLPQESLEEDLAALFPVKKEFRTYVSEYNSLKPPVSYVEDNITMQRGIIDGFSHTYSEDLRVRSIQTALGYSSILLDMCRVVYPRQEEDSWEKLSKSFAENTITYWKEFSDFEATTLLESDSRIRRFLAVDYQDYRQENTITMELKKGEDLLEEGSCWFLLRTHGEKIGSIDGGIAAEIEKDVYLIEVWNQTVQITLRDRD